MGKVLMSWSGGKDCTLALHHFIRERGQKPDGLLTAYSTSFKRVTMHGVSLSLIEKQAESLGIPLYTLGLPDGVDDNLYEELLLTKYKELKELGFTTIVFGDIFLEDLRAYRVRQLDKVGLKYQFPLWKGDTGDLIAEFIELGYQAISVSVNGTLLSKKFAGRLIDHSFISELPPNVDPCGENGEFHTFVSGGPIFSQSIDAKTVTIVERTYSLAGKTTISYWFADLTS